MAHIKIPLAQCQSIIDQLDEAIVAYADSILPYSQPAEVGKLERVVNWVLGINPELEFDVVLDRAICKVQRAILDTMVALRYDLSAMISAASTEDEGPPTITLSEAEAGAITALIDHASTHSYGDQVQL